MRRSIGLLFVVLAVSGRPLPASAAIDMSGVYEAIEFPCHYVFVQTGTHLQLDGTCSNANNPMTATGTVDPVTGQFTVTGEVTGRCSSLVLTGTADGEMFTATYTCNDSGSVTATKCLNGMIDPGEDCQDGNVNDGDGCSSRCRREPAGTPCASDGNVCTDDVIDGSGACVHVPNTGPCDDGNACTEDACDGAGACVSSPLDNAPCSDGDACTVGDACAGGECVPGELEPTVCAAIKTCERTVALTLSACIAKTGARTKKCYRKSGAACLPDDPGTASALAKVASRIGAACPDSETVQAVGYGAAVTPDALIARVQEECTGEVASIAARTFGGPQAALLSNVDAGTASCLVTANSAAVKLVRSEAKLRAACIARAHGLGKPCDVAGTNAKIAAAETSATASIDASCPDLKATIGMDAATYVARAGTQARCVTAAAHGDPGPLALDCGPRAGVTVPARGTWTQVVLDEATYGTRCGDGSPYAFWLRLPPAGSPPEKVVVYLEGGGVCVFEADCASVTRGFRATDDSPPATGILSTSAADNPFSDWTMVYLPYCTQDVHIGGGHTEVFPSVTVHRFGAINLRAALRYLRDVLWQHLGATEPGGYRPDRLTVLFTGGSSGGMGVNYNYHYLLDDLRWIHTTAVSDSGIPLDNGELIGVRGLGMVAQADAGTLAWAAKPHQAPYCLDSTCFIGPVLQAATSARLKAVPEQQILNVSNQVDETQTNSLFFPDAAAWTNALRAAYCANQGRSGIRNWLPAESMPFHVILGDESRWSSVTAAGETLPMFLAGAITDPDAVTDHVDEGTLVADYPGVEPFACPLN